jgi:hypothetical protein
MHLVYDADAANGGWNFTGANVQKLLHFLFQQTLQ